MSWLVSAKQYIPAVIGEPFGGGFFAGYISHTADGNPTHALIVAPRATGATGSSYTLTTNLQWKTANTTTAGTTSAFDGAANTAAMVTAGIGDHPAANFCVGLSIGGFADWYLPARFELDIAYFNLKPSTVANSTGWGINAYSVPRRDVNNTAAYPIQTPLTVWQSTPALGSESFVAGSHFSSTNVGVANVWSQFFEDGRSGSPTQDSFAVRTRAFRRIAL